MAMIYPYYLQDESTANAPTARICSYHMLSSRDVCQGYVHPLPYPMSHAQCSAGLPATPVSAHSCGFGSAGSEAGEENQSCGTVELPSRGVA